MVGTKEKLDCKGDIVCRDEETLYWCGVSFLDQCYNSGTDIDWEWEAWDKADDDLFFKFIDEHDYWEELEEVMLKYFSTPPHYEDDDEVFAYLQKEGVVATAKKYDLHDFYTSLICEDDDMAREYVEWLN